MEFSARIVAAWGQSRRAAIGDAGERAWEKAAHFDLYDDVCLSSRSCGVRARIGLISNRAATSATSSATSPSTSTSVASGSHGKVKPSRPSS